MKRIIAMIALVASLLVLPTYAVSFNKNQVNKEVPVNLSKTFSAAAVLDATTDTLMYTENTSAQIPAYGGVTRLMTAVTIEYQNKKNSVIKAGFDENDYENYLASLLFRDSSEAAKALAVEVAGSEESFVEMMNATAKQLGMVNSIFTSVDGKRDVNAVTTTDDLLFLVYEAYSVSNIKSILRSNIYYSTDGQGSYSREYSLLNKEHKFYIDAVNFFMPADFGDTGFVSMVGMMTIAGREVIAITYESNGYSTDYKNNYATDLKYIYNMSYGKYYIADLTNVARAVVADADGYVLADGTHVYTTVEIPEGESERLTLPVSYGEIILDNYKACTLEIAPLPESCGLNEILTTAVLKYKNDELLNMRLRVNRIVLEDGREYRTEYELYSEEEGAIKASEQYKKNDWIFAAGLVCGCAVIAVVVAEFLKRRLM